MDPGTNELIERLDVGRTVDSRRYPIKGHYAYELSFLKSRPLGFDGRRHDNSALAAEEIDAFIDRNQQVLIFSSVNLF